nr:MAG TPA: hypothetical protein [Caudoviricetes sp.]
MFRGSRSTQGHSSNRWRSRLSIYTVPIGTKGTNK